MANDQISEKELELLEKNLQRIFAMNIMRSTFRELQNAILASANGDKGKASNLFESLLVGEVKEGTFGQKSKEAMKSIIQQYTIPARLAKEVYERGDFVNIITSDLLSQSNTSVFLNRVRRVDGEEFQFITDPESTVNLLHHFLTRIQDLAKADTSRKFITDNKKALEEVRAKIGDLIK